MTEAATLSLPTTVEGVTPAWLSAALQARHPGVNVRAARVQDVILGTSTKIRVALETDDPTLPATLIVKGGFEAHSPMMGPMYANEAGFYTHVQPRITMESPRCFFAGSDPDGFQSIVILEDLRAAGVRWLSALEPEPFEAIAERLRAMAVFHAQTWASPMFEAGRAWDWVGPRFGDWAMVYANRYLMPEVWAGYIASPRGAAVSRALQDRAWMAGALVHLGAVEAAGPRCLIHGDTHLGNLYVTAEGRPGFLDAQVSHTHWSIEVAYHIVAACDLADRAAWEGDLMSIYLEALTAAGAPAPPFGEAMDRYAEAIAYGLFVFLINETRFQTEAVNTAYAARFGAAALAHGTRDRTS